MILDSNGDPLTLRDYQGNPLVVRKFGEFPHASPLTDAHTPYGIQPAGMSGLGDPVFSDEFKAGTLDTAKWDTAYPDTAFWNTTTPGGHLTNSSEPQGYHPSAISFDADGMVFTMTEENTAVPELDYTSGMVTSYPSFNPLYGAFEARMKLSNTNGAWPAFWMMPTDQVWPPEIDIMENWGKASFNLQTEHTFHFPRPTPGGHSGTVHGFSSDVGNAFHVFGCLWEPNRIRWYVDGAVVKDLTTSLADKQMYLIANLAGQQGSTPTVPASIHVDYIRAWSLPA